MPICAYCKKDFDRTSGKAVIMNSGKILYFCSGKCDAYMLELERNPKRLKWTKPEKLKPKAKA
jgi:large subunit ribosomal protein L24e